jgi:hypothetical protein
LVGLGDYSGASATISSFKDIVLANGPPTGDIGPNAFWLLSVNADQLLTNLAPEPVSITDLANETKCCPLQMSTQPVDVVRAPLANVADAQFTVDTVALACD